MLIHQKCWITPHPSVWGYSVSTYVTISTATLARSSQRSHLALLEDGYNIRTVQELLGHKNVKTTMIYTHVLNWRGPKCQESVRYWERDLDEFPVFFSENGDPYVFRTRTRG
ncbi:tyrosine-type recombinase/integrase [Nodosilinea sp. LEGE 07298]|nr:tyrosine-type recombinase/integrase [Nodosilinea sp. LEGE 07298]